MFRLSDAGTNDVKFDQPDGFTRYTTQFNLPAYASQGPDTWYLIDFHFRVELELPLAPSARAYVGASTNGKTAAQVKLETYDLGNPILRWTSLQLIDGGVEGYTTSGVVEMRFLNYLNVQGVAPGRNRLTFWLEPLDGMRVRSFEIMRDSGILATQSGPPKLSLALNLPGIKVEAGKPFEIGYELTVDTLPARAVEVIPDLPDRGLRLIGPAASRFETVDGNARGELKFEADRPGEYLVTVVAVSSNAGQAQAPFMVRADPESSTFIPGWLSPMAVALFAGAGDLLLLALPAAVPRVKRLIARFFP